MFTSFLYHGFGLVGCDYVRTRYTGGAVIFYIKRKRWKLRCPVCRRRDVLLRGTVARRFQTVPIGLKRVFLDLEVQRVECRYCGKVRQEKLGFADPRFSYSHAFERYALDLSKHMTIQDVARHLRISWDVIKEIQKGDLTKRFSKPCLKNVKRIAVDEIAVRKGHRYMMVALDMDTGVVIFVGDGKGSDALEPFWKRLRSSRTKMKAVAMDMSPAYISAVSSHLPKTTIVFDHFHVVKLFNDKLSDLSRELYREAKGDLHKKVMKGTRWLLLKNPENLDLEKREKERLEEALKLNKPLSCAHYLKEYLRQVWLQQNKEEAEKVLSDWTEKAQSSDIKILMKFAKILAGYKSGILAYYDFRISSGPLEGYKQQNKKHETNGLRL
jgi:transposase